MPLRSNAIGLQSYLILFFHYFCSLAGTAAKAMISNYSTFKCYLIGVETRLKVTVQRSSGRIPGDPTTNHKASMQ